ncbi:unnamed protein product [Adineta ricciae]|uniref:Uncharacterized protein n=1 Tax=Adineta ricciae TaxID=249248 RepID=A0A814EAB8_ADIRI|nr:unnamed protein product [Adineta ricciae]CAF1410203.1 unnamed protein product [Adineta ricciae]
MGIGYEVDTKLGTDQHVFSILGPHYGSYYGDIVITFKQEIMFHPDANFSIQAGTGFYSDKAYLHRPWWKDPNDENQRINCFHSAKLHCSVPRYESAAAIELIAVTSKSQKSMDTSLDTIIQQWTAVDSHFVFEGHLPQLIPLDYIDNVYMPKNLFQALSAPAQHSARAVFKEALILTDHVIDLNLIQPGKPVPLDSTRKPYLAFTLEQNLEKIKQRMAAPQISRGIVITVPGTKFDEQIVMPITVSQSYRLYCLDNTQAPNHPEYTYVYWQVMNGDMMLTLSNEIIQSTDEDQSKLRCLLCYIAEKPSQANEDYHEAYSYLNDDHPARHYNNIYKAQFKARSNVFYRGCNTDDYVTCCLKIIYQTNEATLSHAGPNGIYNYEKIHYRFDKSTLDLSRLDYIHVSAGSQDVPIRNLIIRHEQVPDLHPTFDKDFTIDTSDLLDQRRASFDYAANVGYSGSVKKKGPKESRLNKVISRTPITTQQPKVEPTSIFQRIKTVLCCSSANVIVPGPNPPLPARTTASSSVAPSKLPPCRDSIYCLLLEDKDHTVKYSHRCRFNELCRNKDKEPHLTHEPHRVPQCSDDKDCSNRTNPLHRAQFRHTGLPDFLIPCRNEDNCYGKTTEHLIKYFHGEEIPPFKKNKVTGGRHLTPCRYGAKCRLTEDPQHTAKYSHTT